MHDVQRDLTIVDARTIHPKLHLLRTGELSREHRCFAKDDYAAPAKLERDSLCTARRRSLFTVTAASRGSEINRRVGEFHESHAACGAFQGLTGESDDARNLLAGIASSSDRVIAEQFVIAVVPDVAVAVGLFVTVWGVAGVTLAHLDT